jgi:hypothetical protein
MAFKKDAQLIFRYTIVLLIVGVLCYAAFPQKVPDEPVRIVMNNLGGKVLFDHKTHASPGTGYGLECSDCHHNILDDGGEPEACEDCHEKNSESIPNRTDAFHQQCDGCHLDFDIGPEESNKRCAMCHAR